MQRQWWRAGTGLRGPVVALCFMTLGLWCPSQAAEFTCAGGDVACLIKAMNEANSTPEPDSIQLAAGTYTLTAADNETSDGLNGLPVVTDQLTITGATAESSTIERAPEAPAFRLLQVSASGALTLQRLTLRGGSAGFGTGRGGAIYSRGEVAIVESVLTGHWADGCCGAIVILDGRLTIANSHVKANSTASDIGGIGGDSATIVITASTIADNHATYHAGGLYAALGTLTVTGSTFTANVAGFDGAAIFNDRNTLTLANTTLAENASGLHGGGLYNENGVGTLVNSTLADNWAEVGGGGFYNINGAVELQNTIVARNASLFEGVDCDSPTTLITSLGHNLIGDPTGCEVAWQWSDLTGDPGLGTYTEDGELGHGHIPLLAGSRAIDSGDDSACPPTDQLGQPRVGPCDIGAVEFQSSAPVDTTPPAITIAATPMTLWPPNGKLVSVTVSGAITDEPGGSGVNATSAAYVVMDEYGQIQPRGNLTLGADGRYVVTVALEASRRGNDQDGRHYTIAVSAHDKAGNLGVASTVVTVPHDQGQ